MAATPNRRARKSDGARVVIAKGPLLTDAAKIIGKLTSAAIGFEADYTTVAAAELMRKLVHRRIRWKPASGLVMRQRMIKDPGELSIIRAAVQMGAAVYEEARACHPARCAGVGGGRETGIRCATGGSRRHVVRDHRRRRKTGGVASWACFDPADTCDVDSSWSIPVLYFGAIVPI